MNCFENSEYIKGDRLIGCLIFYPDFPFLVSKLKKFVTHKKTPPEQIKCGRKKSSRVRSGDGAKTIKKPH